MQRRRWTEHRVPSWYKPRDQTNPQNPALGLVSKAGSQHLAVYSGGQSSLFMDCTWSIYRFREKELGPRSPQQNKQQQQQIILASRSLEKKWLGSHRRQLVQLLRSKGQLRSGESGEASLADAGQFLKTLHMGLTAEV